MTSGEPLSDRPDLNERLANPADARSASVARRWLSASGVLDPEQLPVTREHRAGGMAMAGVRWLLRAAVLGVCVLGGGAWLFQRDTLSPLELVLSGLLLPGMMAGLALWIWLVHRRMPRWERVRLALETVRYEADTGAWEEPVRRYAGLALRRRRTQRASRRARRRQRTATERALRLEEEIELWWVELVHHDPSRTVVVWASDRHFAASDGLDLVEHLGERLRLPVLTTSGIRRLEDSEDPLNLKAETDAGRGAAPSSTVGRWLMARARRRQRGRRGGR